MKVRQIHENLFYIGKKKEIAVERGPDIVKGKADGETLSSLSGKTLRKAHPKYQVGEFDALGNVIAEDAEFSYLDYLNEDAWVWYIYRLEEVSHKEGEDPVMRYVEKTRFTGTQIEALGKAEEYYDGEG